MVRRLLATVLVVAVSGGCSASLQIYTDGPITTYVDDEPPPLPSALARTASLTKYAVGNTGGHLFCELRGKANRGAVVPTKDAEQMRVDLGLDEPYGDAPTRAVLDDLAAIGHPGGDPGRIFARASRDEGEAERTAQAEQLAMAAAQQGDHAMAHAQMSAAHMRVLAAQGKKVTWEGWQEFNQNLAGDYASPERAYRIAREWFVEDSGVIGPDAPAGSHLDVFIFSFSDTESFELDSRGRVAVLAILVDGQGHATSVLRGSDFLNCINGCDRYTPKPSARPVAAENPAVLAVKRENEEQGVTSPGGNGFQGLWGYWEYILLRHVLHELSEMRSTARASRRPSALTARRSLLPMSSAS